MAKDIFDISHDQNGHVGFSKCYEYVASSYYIKGLSGLLREYLKHCPQCQMNRTRRHLPYGKLQPILSPAIPFHTITIDFVLALPITRDGLNCCLSVTCKFSKRVTAIPGKDTYSAKDWALALLLRLNITDWGLPKVIISDRDRKFLSELWNAIFTKLGVKLMFSTAYHPQSDGQSERSNQTIEIALLYFISTLDNPADWPDVLVDLQSSINNSLAVGPGKTPNEVVYGFTPVRSADLVMPAISDKQLSPILVRREAADAIAFAQINNKVSYDRKHLNVSLKAGDWALIKLHKGYNIPSSELLGRKLSQQYAGPFRILAKIGNLAYHMDLPTSWRIHPVLTIAQLEPCPAPSDDPFHRPRPDLPDSIHVDGDTELVKSWEVERIITHRATKRRGTEYLIRWKGYGAEHDVWRNMAELGNAMDLLRDYEDRIGTAPSPQVSDTVTEQPIADSTPSGPSSAPTLHRPRGRPRKEPKKDLSLTLFKKDIVKKKHNLYGLENVCRGGVPYSALVLSTTAHCHRYVSEFMSITY